MSIIERMAELLGPVPQTQRERPAPDEGVSTAKSDLIERVASDMSRLPDIPGEKVSPGGDRTMGRPARAVGRSTPTHKVDRDRLRRQSMITPDGERTVIAESFRRIKRQVLANAAASRAGAPPANLVLVTSALPGEGKTFCAINLAISIALERDHTVLLVDADVARPSIPRAFGLEPGKGLMNLLLDRRIEPSEVLLKLDIGRLTLMPAGNAHEHSTELLASGAMRELLHEMAERFHDRIIIFDSPPLLAASEASVLANQVGQIVVVVEAGRTSEAALKDALGRIDASKVTGLLLNKGEVLNLGYGYGGYG